VRRPTAALAALLLLAGCGGGGGDKLASAAKQAPQAARPQTQTQTTKVEVVKATGHATGAEFDPETIYKTEGPGVVTLVAFDGSGRNLFGRASQALGSGFVIDGGGYIATNAHVVTSDSGAKAKLVYVQFSDGNRLQARIVGVDLDSDIALVKVDPSHLRGADAKIVPLPFGSTAELRVGDPVAAIGSPFGEQQSLSVGVVSALNRDIESLTNFSIANAIQTDAAINHGNSGGPLLDSGGKVIGINAQIRSTGGGGEGVGFAIPIETVKHSLDQLRAKGRVDYAYLGISTVSLYPQLAERLKLDPTLSGALVDKVESGGPADEAGVRGAFSHITFQGVQKIPVGSDLIVAVDKRKLSAAEDLSDVIGVHRPGQIVKLHIIRNGKPRTINVALGLRPE
jgi:S1-C subfamily serine protease